MKIGKIHSTNYFNTLIQIADDCEALQSEVPAITQKGKSIPRLQYELLVNKPYHWTSDKLLFHISCVRKGIEESDSEYENFFSKGQACLRASSLVKRYAFGFHFNEDGKIALVPLESDEYKRLQNDPSVKKIKGMRSAK